MRVKSASVYEIHPEYLINPIILQRSCLSWQNMKRMIEAVATWITDVGGTGSDLEAELTPVNTASYMGFSFQPREPEDPGNAGESVLREK